MGIGLPPGQAGIAWLSPYQIVVGQLLLGGLVLVLFIYARHDSLPRGRVIWFHLAIAALLANIAPYLLFAVAERQIDSVVAGMINATTPLFTVIISVLVRHEPRQPPANVVGLLIGLAGTQFTSWGAVAALVASLCYAASYVYMDRFLVSRDLSPVNLSAGQLLAGGVLTLIAMPMVRGWTAPTWRIDAILSLIALGIISTGFAYVLNYRIITSDGASAASIVTYLVPIAAVILGTLVLNEIPTLHAIIGMVIILIGVMISRRRVVRSDQVASHR